MREVPGFEDRFMVSISGEIVSKASRTGKGITRKQTSNNYGYRYITYLVEGKTKKLLVHRAVALAYLEPVAGKDVVNHKDSNPSNNHVSNLEWVTTKENVAHAINAGRIDLTRNQGSKHGMSKLTEAQVGMIKQLKGTVSGIRVAKLYKVDDQTIYDIWNGRRWKHVQ